MEIKEEYITRFCYAMFNLMHGIKQVLEDCCAMFGDLSVKELMIINCVGEKQNTKMTDIADSSSAPLSTLTSIVDKLVEKNYLDRYHSNEDRRVILVTLASKGKEIYNTCVMQKQEMAKKVLSQFKVQDQKNLIEYLEKMSSINNLKK